MTNNELRALAECSRKGDVTAIEQIIASASGKAEFQDYELNSAVSQLIRSRHYKGAKPKQSD